MPHIYTVRELTGAVKDVLEAEFPFLWVRGQVTNLSRPGSGHVYFSLKDEDAVLQVVWFRSAQRLSMTLDPARLVQGQEVICAGRMAVYPPRGGYQLIAELLQDHGVGRFQVLFEELKKRLTIRGYFDQERKRPLPGLPSRVAVITAPSGAAVRDFLCLACERGCSSAVRIYPVRVQGEGASEDIAAAVKAANRDGWAEVLVLIRGGGSLEDLWAFNTEEVARAVFESALPVICGVGHEVDVSIADLVADMRAATPSHAAQILWPERQVLVQEVDDLETRLTRRWQEIYQDKSARLAQLERAISWFDPNRRLERLDKQVQDLERRLGNIGQGLLDRRRERLDQASRTLARVLGGPFFVPLAKLVQTLERDLHYAGSTLSSRRMQQLDLLFARLSAVNPDGPLQRGYARIVLQDGSFLRSPAQVKPGDGLDIVVRDGSIRAKVEPEPGGSGQA
ncbi:MAG: exodeoxyribonuclease VII large subunit [Desulfovibrionales bacterium]